jgi:hypothetical protein
MNSKVRICDPLSFAASRFANTGGRAVEQREREDWRRAAPASGAQNVPASLGRSVCNTDSFSQRVSTTMFRTSVS